MKIFSCLVICLLFLSACAKSSDQNQVCYQKYCFNVEIAKTQQEVSSGLMDRKFLDQNSGMLFVFSENKNHSFWMKNTLIPLDMIWLDFSQRIIHIERNVPPCTISICPSYGPKSSSLYVLEINAGLSDETGMKLGERLKFNIK